MNDKIKCFAADVTIGQSAYHLYFAASNRNIEGAAKKSFLGNDYYFKGCGSIDSLADSLRGLRVNSNEQEHFFNTVPDFIDNSNPPLGSLVKILISRLGGSVAYRVLNYTESLDLCRRLA